MEVRLSSQLKTELSVLKDEVNALREVMSMHKSSPFSTLPVSSVDMSAPAAGDNEIVVNTPSSASSVSFANLARELQSAPSNHFSSASISNKQSARRPTAICGKALDMSSLAVEGVRRANVFITRLRPDTTKVDVTDLIMSCFPVCTSVKVEKLETRFETYSSFQAELYVKRSKFDELITDIYMAGSCWPSGILVRRFYHTKNGVQK